jgi:hypothetical protein
MEQAGKIKATTMSFLPGIFRDKAGFSSLHGVA